MSSISFKRVSLERSRIYDADGDCVGDVYRQPDILHPGQHYYVIHLDEDPRGPLRVFDRSRIQDEAHRRLATHPYY